MGVIHPDGRGLLREKFDASLHRGEPYDFEHRIVLPDGEERIVHRRAEVVSDEEGEPLKMVGTVQDVSERKRAEEEIRELNESLERRVEERTQQLADAVAGLEMARNQAEVANRAKSEFLANMSHEIRTPMNGVIGMTGLLLDTDLTPEQREYAETVRTSGESLLTIINDILDFSKVEAGRMDLETIDFDLRTTVEETVSLLAGRARAKNLELANLIEYGVPTALRGDPWRLRQILTNLLGNAIKFTEEGEVVSRVGLVEESDERAKIRFSVTDTGIGMTEEHRSRLFQSFTQADASTTRRYGGTGLGLAISRQLVELMEGEIGVESEHEIGSTFWFEVPLQKQSGGPRAALSPRTDLRDLRVLVVDDNATNRKILREQITSWNLGNGDAESGPRALQTLRSAADGGEPYNVAILDMQMPGMDGMELARTIKADPAISSTRLVLLTSIGKRADSADARQAGIEAYLTKPVKQSELYDALATVMGAPEATPEEDPRLVTRHTLREREAGTRVRLLVAEDNAVNQKVAVRMLESLSYRADVAANGLEAVEAISRVPYHAVLMDVQMPEMDGYEATAAIRKREGAARHTPIIAMTANAMRGDREKALEAGMDDYVPKPVKPEDLDEVLRRWIPQEAPEPGSSPVASGGGVTAPDPAPDKAENRIEDSLDPDVLAGLRELGDPDLLSELTEMFFDDASSRLATLRETVEGSDARSVEQIAHALKGSSGNMGARRMAAICAELEDVGASGDLSRARALLEQLEEEFGRVRPALEAETATG